MDLLTSRWLEVKGNGCRERISPVHIGDLAWVDLYGHRPDFHAALYQFLIGLLQTAYAPINLEEWRDRWSNPPSAKELEAVFAPYRDAFLLENDGPAFMQDLHLSEESNQLPVVDLLIDAGSDCNRFFNKPAAEHGLCECCFVQALLTLQLNAPAGGRGVRTSARGGGPLTTLLLPADEHATLWQKLWLNVLPLDALDYPAFTKPDEVLPWLLPTRTSDGPGALDTQPGMMPPFKTQHVHPLQVYWSMSRRIRLDASTVGQGDCAICGAQDVRLIRHYRTRHGGTNYTGAWVHPLTPYSLDPKGEKPPLSIKGRQAGRGYRDWLGLVLSNDDHQPAAARVVAYFTVKVKTPRVRLWCFGYDMSNMKALCWYDSTLPVHTVAADQQRRFIRCVKALLDVANDTANALHKQVKAAWFRRPGEAKPQPAVEQSFWQGSEADFYRLLEGLEALDFEVEVQLAEVYRDWLLRSRCLALGLFDQWVLAGPSEDMDMQRVVRARAALGKELSGGKAMKPLWKIVNSQHKERV
ncbi:type I-E CRISPR-associated protein Cse1/CasA [Azomonas macrocytogenes]|uniref:CRISPR system Cascade subunit CasA n=1 Tax=Azomonas macrocytogenes TaxID=69962 RepID=A0A839T1A0_AZOMA|nr:type I-E CRISPR-associated protein Cse1/CasA [Azomonas macrocytogenes]MBB3101735.1 CRISPR system Cascade subunit CasA [Azomonas macrocytogenes]